MNKKLFRIIVVLLLLVGVLGAVSTTAIFQDIENVQDNEHFAGSIDLNVNGQEGNIQGMFSADKMKPGNTYNSGCVTLNNTGDLPGILTVQVANLVSKENGRIEPEISDGDPAGAEFDPTGYDANSGDGELWDQITIKMCMDDGTGSHTGNGQCDWDDTIIKNFSSTQDDYSSSSSIALNADLAAGKNIQIPAGGSAQFCMGVKFIDDTSNSWWGGQSGLTNNMAMTDSALLDIIFGLKQTP